MTSKVQYSPDGKAWFDGSQWVTLDCRQMWDGKRWRRTPREAVEWWGVQLKKMKVVEEGGKCERVDCKAPATHVVSDADPYQEPFHAMCADHAMAPIGGYPVVWPKR